MFKFFRKIKSALTSLFSKPIDETTFAKLEQLLYEADLGTKCAGNFVEHLRKFLKKQPEASPEEILHFLQNHALTILNQPAKVTPTSGQPLVVLIVGVNGSGKTTSIAKLAKLYEKQGKTVLLAAADTFRAAAIDQLALWAERLKVEIVKAKPGSDPSSVVFDALSAAKARNTDVVLIDTAGRLQNKTDLMHELEKIRRVCTKVVPGSPHEIILVLDATTGQNALDQARTFHQFTPLTGILLAKLDGSAKGGIILAIYEELGIPVRWIGVGEKADDLQPFQAETYVKDLF
jgi:fused signal recognition particle receptor